MTLFQRLIGAMFKCLKYSYTIHYEQIMTRKNRISKSHSNFFFLEINTPFWSKIIVEQVFTSRQAGLDLTIWDALQGTFGKSL